MNFLVQEAYNDGCDYFYRINDDSQFLTETVQKQQMQPGKRFEFLITTGKFLP